MAYEAGFWLRALVGVTLAAGLHAQPCPTALRVAFLDKALPPMLHGEGPRFPDPPGEFVRWTREALTRVNCPAELVRVPQRRLISDTAVDVNQITLFLAHTPERAQQLAFPLREDGQLDTRLALGESQLALYVREDRRHQVAWDGRRLSPEGMKVGIVGGGVEEPLARAAGWTLDLALSHAGSITKLRRGQVDVAVLPTMSFNPQSLAEPPALVALQPMFAPVYFFAPVSPALQQRHPEWVRRFWRALCEVARGDRSVPSCH
ncbi:hypothetical protein HNQ51_002525 [Inhella inkyongensis]|uniref:Solute-binding protein family 3/N-terminal domain-containing protein n=1 Tax=Inhella inkyongensis TaxID=392593 RepID=A0A840S867_9BURK|nr:amino acid ABC transporter substrate-binding protein [Inhella inkyongensis]MBB5205206.1 hypothetical protein [Inhella inkyongensis]